MLTVCNHISKGRWTLGIPPRELLFPLSNPVFFFFTENAGGMESLSQKLSHLQIQSRKICLCSKQGLISAMSTLFYNLYRKKRSQTFSHATLPHKPHLHCFLADMYPSSDLCLLLIEAARISRPLPPPYIHSYPGFHSFGSSFFFRLAISLILL